MLAVAGSIVISMLLNGERAAVETVTLMFAFVVLPSGFVFRDRGRTE